MPAADEPGLFGNDPNDAVNLGKKHYRANNFGLAEKYFRHAAELHPSDAEAWLGLAASYDRLRAASTSPTAPTVRPSAFLGRPPRS